jgi:hypothetical protein
LLQLLDQRAGAGQHFGLHFELAASRQIQFAQRGLQNRSKIAFQIAPQDPRTVRQTFDQTPCYIIDADIFHGCFPRLLGYAPRPVIDEMAGIQIGANGKRRVMEAIDFTIFFRGTDSAPSLQRVAWKAQNTRTGRSAISRIKVPIIAKCTS